MRTVAVRPESGEDWENLVTSMAVSERSVEEVEMEQRKLPKLRNGQFALFPFAVAFDFDVFEGIARGEISHKWLNISKGSGSAYRTLRIKTKQFNPLKLKMLSIWGRPNGTPKWVLTAANSNTSPEREQLWSIVQRQSLEAKRLYYSSMEDLIKDALKVDDLSHAKDFELTISNLAQIGRVTFSKSTIDVEISKISGLKNLRLNVIQSRAKNGGSHYPIWRERITIDEKADIPNGQIYIIEESIQPPDLLPFDSVSLQLIHWDSALQLDETWERAPLRNVVEPFFKVLGAFCPTDEFKKMLLEPENCGKEPEKIFENAIVWLLSLAGFSTIYLGTKIKNLEKKGERSFEVVRVQESGYQIGGADIIAYEENKRLLLIDCDTGSLDDKKIHGLIETQQYFKNLSDFGKIECIPVLFSPRAYGEVKDMQVAIADRTVIESIFEDLARGDRESARSRILVGSKW